jgi:predicted NAD-dependent protein-ADP-ribosyltransferase YbiA (DUF1768 family)
MAYGAMRRGTKEKFKQNPLLMEALLATGKRELVYVGLKHSDVTAPANNSPEF